MQASIKLDCFYIIVENFGFIFIHITCILHVLMNIISSGRRNNERQDINIYE